MPYNTKRILTDIEGKPIPQFFDPILDDYYPLLGGQNIGPRSVLYGPDGSPLSVVSSKLGVRATEIEAKQDTIIGFIDGIEALLTAIRDTAGIKKITDAVDIGDRAARVLGKITADDAAIAALGALAAAAVTDPATSASVIALLKGLLKQLQGTGSGATPVTLTGSSLLVGKVQNVTTAGTRVQLPDQACREVTIIAKRGNTGYIYVGGDDVSASVYGAELEAKDSITIAVENTNKIYIDSSISGEGISYVAI